MLLGNVADAHGQQIGALGDYLGAPMEPSSYRIATAKWVGFITTKSALGTAFTLLRSAMSRCLRRILALTSGCLPTPCPPV